MRHCLVAPFLVLGLATRAAGAQHDSTVAPAFRGSTVRGVWASGAVGFGGDRFFDSIGLHLQRGRAEMSVRKDAVGVGDAGPTSSIGVLVGVATTSAARWHAATSLGVARSSRTAYSVASRGYEPATAVGAMVAVDLALRAGQNGGAGVGLTTSASFNAVHSYAAIGLQASFGRWR